MWDIQEGRVVGLRGERNIHLGVAARRHYTRRRYTSGAFALSPPSPPPPHRYKECPDHVKLNGNKSKAGEGEASDLFFGHYTMTQYYHDHRPTNQLKEWELIPQATTR